MTDQKRQCPSCNDMVPTTVLETDTARELQCGFCGLTLDRTKPGQSFSEQTSPSYSQDIDESQQAFQKEQDQQQLPPLIHIAEDSRFIRRIVMKHLESRFPNAEVIGSEDGKIAVENLTRALLKGERRGVSIFDLQMPQLNGISAAIAMRAVESALAYRPLPVIFFSAVRANDKLKEAMTSATPASYLHKSDTENPKNMLGRLEEVMSISIKRAYG